MNVSLFQGLWNLIKMRKGGSKPKGAAAEREVAKLLSLWWTNGEDDSVFYLTAGSGARQTSRRKCGMDTHNSAGDLGYLDISGKPLIDKVLFEIKRGYNNRLDVLSVVDAKVTAKPNILLQWLEKAEQEKEDNQRNHVFLIMRRDYKEYVIVIPIALSEKIEKVKKVHTSRRLTLLDTYMIIPLEDFFKWIDGESLSTIL